MPTTESSSSTAPSATPTSVGDLEEKTLDQLNDLRYRQRLVVNNLQNDLFAETDSGNIDSGAVLRTTAEDLMTAQSLLYDIEDKIEEATSASAPVETEPEDESTLEALGIPPTASTLESAPNIREFRPTGTTRSGNTRSLESTGVDVTVDNYLEHLPTAFYHLLSDEETPLVVCTVSTNLRGVKRLRVTSFIEGYTAKAVDTVEVKRGEPQSVRQLPSLFPRESRGLNELTRATLNVQVEDLDTGKILEHRTEGIWLLARTTAQRSIKDAITGEITDFSPYLAAFVTPNEPSVMKFVRTVVRRHHQQRLQGYGGDVESQVQAIYDALKEDLDLAYVHSIVNFDLEDNTRSQRIRLPRECIDSQMGNCLDVTLLFASLLESISLNPVIALVPGHAFVGWQTAEEQDEWHYIETTMLQTNSFGDAKEVGTTRANNYRLRAQSTGNEAWFKPLIIGKLRTQQKITPME